MHERKKQGVRKDKKVARMRESVEQRHEAHDQRPPHEVHDQNDIQTFKPGSASDHSAPPH